jgi:hypothetical protein
MAAIRPDSNVFKCLAESRVAAVHILDRDHQDMAQRFFAPTRCLDGTINGEPFVPGVMSAPILQNARAYFECLVRHIVRHGGDHAVAVMEVVEAKCRAELRPLIVAASPWAADSVSSVKSERTSQIRFEPVGIKDGALIPLGDMNGPKHDSLPCTTSAPPSTCTGTTYGAGTPHGWSSGASAFPGVRPIRSAQD